MCGIAGIISPYTSLVVPSVLSAMLDTLRHRGPDGEGSVVNAENTIALGSRRLAILDLSPAAAQPLQYRGYTVVFNGEIYNYTELKEELRGYGYTFSTSGDTEVIPAAYDHWGHDCLHHLDGMFAFAIYHSNNDSVFIARDRFGEKPLYYHATYLDRGRLQRLLFASEIKALWAAGVPKEINGTMLLNYISLGHLQNAQKKTDCFYGNILSLPPGHYLTVQPAAGSMQMKRWYRLPATGTVHGTDVIEEFGELLSRSVQRRLRSDVPTGSGLSGGIDSASIVGLAQNIHPSLDCYSAIFPGFEKDESYYSKRVADHFGLKRHTVTPSVEDWISGWEKLTYHQEEPLQSSSVLTQFMLYRQARENGTVVLLDGQGADETLGGYTKHLHWFLQELLRTHDFSFAREKKQLGRNGFAVAWSWKNYAAAFFPRRAAHMLQKRAMRIQNGNTWLDPDFLRRYQNPDSLQKPVIRELNDILYEDTFHVGLEALLRFADRNAMAHSLEVRSPFLQHELVEFAFSLPARLKIHNGFTKWILRESRRSSLPAEITWRKGKTGYEPPQRQWMEHAAVQNMIQEGKKKLVAQGILLPGVLSAPVRPHGAHDAAAQDWRYLNAAALYT